MTLKTPATGLYVRIFNLFVEVLAHTSIYNHYAIPIVKKFYGSRWVGGKDEEIFNWDGVEINGFTVTVNTTRTGLEPSLICYAGKHIFCNIPDGCSMYMLEQILKKLAVMVAPNENSEIAVAFGTIAGYLIAKLVNSVSEDTAIVGMSLIENSPAHIITGSAGATIALGHLVEEKAEYLRNLKDSNINVTAFTSLISKLFDNYEIFSWLEYPNGEPYQANLIC